MGKHILEKIRTKEITVKNLSSILVGVSGEYFVAAELSRRGYIASITLRNSKGIDIIATKDTKSNVNKSLSNTVNIQVKTNSSGKKDWILNAKADDYVQPSHFYVFVNLVEPEFLPEYHVVPSKDVANYVSTSHKEWLSKIGKKGQPHKDSPMRHFKDPDNKYLGKWELLDLVSAN